MVLKNVDAYRDDQAGISANGRGFAKMAN